jgi:hypothetical protein
MKSITVTITQHSNSFTNPATNKKEFVHLQLCENHSMRFLPDFKESVSTKQLIIEYLGESPFDFITGFVARFESGDDDHYISLPTENQMIEFLTSLDGETISNDDFNFFLEDCQYLNTSSCGDAKYQTENKPYLTVCRICE